MAPIICLLLFGCPADGAAPRDAGVDMGTADDIGMTDAGPDAPGLPDMGPPDLGPPDLGPPDLGPPDLGPPDLGPPCTGCCVSNNGSDTIDLPAPCPLRSDVMEPLQIIDGLPPGTTVELAATLDTFTGVMTQAGGTLGGEESTLMATLRLTMTGTGALAGFSRSINMPVSIEWHWAPRTPGQAVQTFASATVSLQGSVFGDPDFDQLEVVAGTDFTLASPGTKTLTRHNASTYAVTGAIDLTYQTPSPAPPGGALDGLSGTTQSMSTLDIVAP